MGTRSNPDPDPTHPFEREVLIPEDRDPTPPPDDLDVFGLVRQPEPPDSYLHHALPLRPDDYFNPTPDDR